MNLERVQGDERDAIMLSVGYGKNADGKMLYRFGPINNEGGERRLNVAVTRAKRRMTLISSFSASDMDPQRTTSEGAKLLRLYLQYAESRGSNLGNVVKDKHKLNPFEVDVRDTLTRAGIPVVAQYGSSGYWIDYAAKHPTKPGQMVLAIECDGATYHSSATARDRDRLRQDQLERLGWTFHRIWSSDWFRHKDLEIERAVAVYQAAVRMADDQAARREKGRSQGELPKRRHEVPPPQRAARPNVGRRPNIGDYIYGDLTAIIHWIESDGLLRTEDQLLEETMHELGFMRRGTKIVSRISAAMSMAREARQAS
jgi:very-short-patch-repair endonuclease